MNRTQIFLLIFNYLFPSISLSLFPTIFLPCFFAGSVTLTSGNLFPPPYVLAQQASYGCTHLSTFAKGKCSLCENIFRMLTP